MKTNCQNTLLVSKVGPCLNEDHKKNRVFVSSGTNENTQTIEHQFMVKIFLVSFKQSLFFFQCYNFKANFTTKLRQLKHS